MRDEDMPECYRGCHGTLKYIDDLLFDYDGCNSVETLKELIDEVRDIIKEEFENEKVTITDTFMVGSTLFKAGSKYKVTQDEHYVYITSDNDVVCMLTYDEAIKYIK